MKRVLFAVLLCLMAIGAQAQGNKTATGEFRFESPWYGDTYVVFNAVLKSDGRVSGQVYVESSSGWDMFEVQYLGIVGNRAYLSAYNADGFQRIFVVEDNGEGFHAAPDRAMGILYFYFWPEPGPPAAVTPSIQNLLNMYMGFLSRPITSGNIQVRG